MKQLLISIFWQVYDVRPCENWDKQVEESLGKVQLLLRPSPLSVLKEMPTLEDKVDSPGLVLRPSIDNRTSMAQKAGIQDNIEPPIDEGASEEEEWDNIGLSKSKSEPLKRLNKIEVPLRAREDEEFVLGRPKGKKPLSIEIKKVDEIFPETAETPDMLISKNQHSKQFSYEMTGLLSSPKDGNSIQEQSDES